MLNCQRPHAICPTLCSLCPTVVIILRFASNRGALDNDSVKRYIPIELLIRSALGCAELNFQRTLHGFDDYD